MKVADSFTSGMNLEKYEVRGWTKQIIFKLEE